MAEQHQQMHQQHPHQGQQQHHITAQILNVQGGVATLDESVPVQIMMPSTVVMDEHQQMIQQEQHHQVPQHVQEMQEAVVQEAVGTTTQVPSEDPKIANKKELSKQWKSLCKRAKQWCSLHDDSIPNFVMMYLDENRLVWEGPDHMESFISDESVISAFLRTAALSESLIGMEKRGADDTQDVQRLAKKQKKAETPTKKNMTDDEVIASILEKPEAEMDDATREEVAGDDDDQSEADASQSQSTEVDQPSQSTSEGPSQGGEGDVLSQVIESVIKDWAPGQGPPPTGDDGDASNAGKKVLIYDHLITERGGNLSCTCNVCYKQFPSLKSLEGHMKIHPINIIRSVWKGKKKWQMHTCDVCWRSFYLKKNYLAHKSSALHKLNVSRKRRKKQCRVASTSDGPHKCGRCGKEFKHLYKLQHHMSTAHMGVKPFACQHCEAKFVNRGDLNRHTNIFHGKKARQMMVNNDGRLVLAEERKHGCHICDRRFRSKGDLVRHVRIHTGEKPFQCLHCEKAFAHKSDLNKHLRVHTGEKPYDCPYCGRGFKDLGNMKAHCRTHTKEHYICQICKTEFITAKELRSHHWTHAGTISTAAIVRPRAQPLATPPSQVQWPDLSVTEEPGMPTTGMTVDMTESIVAVSSVQPPAPPQDMQVQVPVGEPILVTTCNLTIDTNAFNQLLQHTHSGQ